MSAYAIMLARQGVADAASRPGPASARDPFAAGRSLAFSDEAGFTAGTVSLAAGSILFEMPHAEMLVVLAGAVTVTVEGVAMVARAGQAVVLPRGLSGMLAAEDETRCVFNAMAGLAEATESQRQPIALDPALPRNPSPGPAPEIVIGPRPSCHSLNLFTDGSGMRAGIWDVTTPCERGVVPHRVHELMHLIEGSVTLTHQSGEALEVKAGDSVFVPRGAPYAWKNNDPVVKYYVVL